MLDFSIKEFVRSFHYSNLNEDREYSNEEKIFGRTYTKYGKHTATTVVVNLWKVYDPSVKQSKYVYLGGVARQHPNDNVVTLKEGLEIAEEKAFIEPEIMWIYPEQVCIPCMIDMIRNYVWLMPKEFVRTKEEIYLSENPYE